MIVEFPVKEWKWQLLFDLVRIIESIAKKIKRGCNTMLSYDHVPAFWLKTWLSGSDQRRSNQCQVD